MQDEAIVVSILKEREAKEREEALDRLRALLDWFEAHPNAPIPFQLRSSWPLHCRLNKEDLPRLRDIGDFKKQFNAIDGDFEAIVNIQGVKLIYYTQRDNVCTPRVVGKRIVPEETVPEQVIPEHEEDIVEWDCGEPVLSLIGDIGDKESENEK